MLRLVLLASLAGCQLVFPFEPEPDGPVPDAPPRVCDPGTPFPQGAPVNLDTSESVEAARFEPDRRTIYVSLCSSTDKASCDLYAGQYKADRDHYTLFTDLDGVNASSNYDSYPTITPAADVILFSSTRSGTVQIYSAGTVNGKFADPMVLIVGGNTFSNEPYLLGDSRTLYFSGGTVDSDGQLFRAQGTPPAFGTPIPVASVNTVNQELAPVVTDDEREIFFASNRQQPTDPMALDIYTATRGAAGFNEPVRVDALSDKEPGTIDWPLWISPDRCDLYYINKAGDLATLYMTSR